MSERAEAVNLTASHLCRLFKAETGVSPNKYLKLLRIQRARQLLDTTFLNVKEIMTKVGVKDESHFVRDFELICGSSPARYRNGRQDATHETTVPKSANDYQKSPIDTTNRQ